MQSTQTEGHKGVKSTRKLTDESGADHELVTNDFRLLRVIPQGGEE